MPVTTDVIRQITSTGVNATLPLQGKAVVYTGFLGSGQKLTPNSASTQIPVTILENLYTNRFPNSGWWD